MLQSFSSFMEAFILHMEKYKPKLKFPVCVCFHVNYFLLFLQHSLVERGRAEREG